MIYFCGNSLRAPTLHLRGERQTPTVVLGTFMFRDMAQLGSAHGWGP